MWQLRILLLSLFGLFIVFLVQVWRLHSFRLLQEKVNAKIKADKLQEKVQQAREYKATAVAERKTKTRVEIKYLPEIKRLFRQAEMEMTRDALLEAEQLLVQLLALDPYHVSANEKLALIYLKTDRPRKAELLYLENLDQDPKNALILSNLGLAYYQQNKYREAIDAYEKAIEIDSRKPGRFVALGQIYLLTRQPKKALENFERAFRRDRRNVEYLFLIAEAYKQMGRWAFCRETLEKILALQPYNQNAKEELRKLSEKHVLGEPETSEE